MKETGNEFGRELRRLRLEGRIKYSQTKLAELAEVISSYISQLETGKKVPTPRVIHKLSGHLGVTTNHLLGKIGMVEMDLASTFASNHDQLRKTPHRRCRIAFRGRIRSYLRQASRRSVRGHSRPG